MELGGKRYIEKPRPSATDITFADFCDAMTALCAQYMPFCVRPEKSSSCDVTLVPYIENMLARDDSNIVWYYNRCGALLALVELFGATDLHSENMIAHGDSPVLVDLETLLAGVMPNRGQYNLGLGDSLMFCHLLPNWMLDGDQNRDIGALTGEGKNQLMYQGAPCPAYQHIPEIVLGFCETYEFLCAHREQVASTLRLFDHAQFRKLLRPTEVYGRLCDRIEALPDTASRIQCAERLRRAYALDADPAWARKMERVCQSEIDAVLRGDIPYFFSQGNEKSLRDWKGVVCEDYFVMSPVDHAIERLYKLNETDMRDQTRIIEQSLQFVNPTIDAVTVTTPRQVMTLLESRALETNPCSWIVLTTDDKGRAFLQSIGFGLYDGLLGVLCFYAALYEATGDDAIKQTIEKRYAPYRAMYIEKRTPLAARADIVNLTHGVGGHILAHAYLARCLNDNRYLADAAALLARFEFDHLPDSVTTDIYGGISGLLIALPCLLNQGIDEQIKTIAQRLADIVRKDEPKLTGYAHGAAGETLALAAAQTVLGDRRYEADILRMLTAENETYDPQTHNWPDLRDPDAHGFMHGLCSGAPGIGLARTQMLSFNISDETRAICETDINRIREYYETALKPLKRDSLCCGNAARIEGEKTLRGDATSCAINSAPVLFHPLDTNDFPPGLLQGWAGIGYALTRQQNATSRGIFDK